jgi:ketosteroid isomerase-like protein
MANPEPQTCHGRAQLEWALPRQAGRGLAAQVEWALPRQAGRGLAAQVEEITAHGDKVLVIVHTPGLDQHRAWAGEDRNYLVLTLSGGQVVAMRAFRNRDEARAFTGLAG